MFSKVIVGDNPESAFMSAGQCYQWLEPGPDTLAHMLRSSPVAWCHQVQCPVLLAISKCHQLSVFVLIYFVCGCVFELIDFVHGCMFVMIDFVHGCIFVMIDFLYGCVFCNDVCVTLSYFEPRCPLNHPP